MIKCLKLSLMFIVVIGNRLQDFFDSIYQQLSALLKKSVDILLGFRHCQFRSMGMLYINELLVMQLLYRPPPSVLVGSLSQSIIHFTVHLVVSPLFNVMKYVM